MNLLNIDSLKALFASWRLLITLTLVLVVLWLAPDEWLVEQSVAVVRNQYKGEIGFLSITLILLLVSKAVVDISVQTRSLASRLPTIIRRRREFHAKVMRRLTKLENPERELLLQGLKLKQRRFELPSSDPRVAPLFDAGIITIKEHEGGMVVFEVHKWLWKKLQTRLEATDRPDDNSHTGPTRKSSLPPSSAAD